MTPNFPRFQAVNILTLTHLKIKKQTDFNIVIVKDSLRCRGDRIRTCDHLVPNQVRYRTALRPEQKPPMGGFAGAKVGAFFQ